MKIAKVEPLTSARALRGPFDYLIPEDMEVAVGSLLLVSFANRDRLGVVVELAEDTDLDPERLSVPRALVGSTTPELVELGLWVADRYCSTRSRGLALALPPGSGTGSRPRWLKPRTERIATLTDEGRRAIGAEGSRLGERQRAALSALAEHDELSTARLRAVAEADSTVLKRLEDRGLVSIHEAERRRVPIMGSVAAGAGGVDLSAAQRAASERVVAALDGVPGERELLLHGVTGSGKTEVYLAAIEAALARGSTAILLVPEIGLTPQTMGRVSTRLGDSVAVLHSGLSEGERFDEWRRLREGQARVCVGPRSAVFAPLSDLGLIVVDEEHDSSYKQEGDPRYDAREVARRRAQLAGAVYVAGTATPRPESWLGMERISLPERVDERPLPPVEVLDMREVSPRAGPLHPRTREALLDLGGGGKAIVMMNRRGFSPHLSCGSCGEAIGCPQCDVSLVLHRGGGAPILSCHHCGYSTAPPERCPGCNSAAIARHGAGTQRLEELIGELVAPTPVFRLDADSVRQTGGHHRVLAEFEHARGGILVGTQMVAKGHDFPDVELSVLIDADSTLRYPDFRAEERTFALVAQLAGRSGRGERGGRVLVQTLAPDAVPIVAAARHDAAGFLDGELSRRREFGYPPYSSLLAVEMAGADDVRLADLGEWFAERIAPDLGAGAELLGPAPRFRRRGKHRRRILLKSSDLERESNAVREALADPEARSRLRGMSVAVDVDPQ